MISLEFIKGNSRNFTIILICSAIIISFILNMTEGSVHIPWSDVTGILFGESVKPVWRYIVLESRFPQAVTALLCGASLAICGLMLQTAFCNPLAGPSIFGINSGASLGVAIVILVFNGSLTTELLSVNGFPPFVSQVS